MVTSDKTGFWTRWQSRRTCSPPPLTKTQKLKLTDKQPLKKKKETNKKKKKKIFYIQRERRSHNEMVGEYYNQISYSPGGRPTQGKIIISQRFLHKTEF